MKKFLLAAFAALFVSGSAMAIDNEPEEGLTWQGQVGLNLSNFNTKGLAKIGFSEYGTKPGANIGVFGRYVLPSCHGAYAKFGVQYNMLGVKGSFTGTDIDDNLDIFTYDVDSKVALHYIDVPVHVGFQYGITDEWSVYADFGPYFGFGLSGKVKEKSYINNKTIDAPDFSWFKKGDNGEGMKRFDAGIGLNIGGEYMNHYILNFGLDWGLTNQLNNDWGKNDKLKNFNFSISVGYRL